VKDFIVLDWCVADICNMNCEYCISSDIKKNEPAYRNPNNKTVLSIAYRIKELSYYVKKITVNLCGGEPLLAENIDEAIEVLSEVSNIELVLITNFRLIDKIQTQLSKFKDLFISLHIKYRSEDEVTAMINKINKLQSGANISISQVDYKLSDKDLSELARINYSTNKSVNLQTYNIPIIDSDKHELSKYDYYKSPYGKCCLIGNMFFNISSDGILSFDLWCHKNDVSGKINFLRPIPEIVEIINNKKYFTCPFSYCPCNYNVTFHENYLAAMKEFETDEKMLFKWETRKKKAILMNQLNVLKIDNKLNLLEIKNLKEDLSKTEISFARLKKDYTGMKSTWSWRIGFFITEKLKYIFGWTPFLKNYLRNKNSDTNDG
jgi:organic radical activating enzyme